MLLLPYYSLKTNTLTLFHQPENYYQNANIVRGWKNLDDNSNKYGELSANAQRRLRTVVDFMIYLSSEKSLQGRKVENKIQEFTTEYEKSVKYNQKINYKLAFITLTLPASQFHSDNEIKAKCLNHFLTVLRNKFKIKNYVWKAEKQENGNIHFHILIDKFIHHAVIRKIWNSIIEKLNYVSEYQKNQLEFFKNGFRMSENKKDRRSRESQLKAYHENLKTKFTNPNSTDIHALYKIKNINAYISKYLAKNVTKSKRVEQIEKIKNEHEKINFEINKLKLLQYDYQTYNDEFKVLQKKIDKLNVKSQALDKKLLVLKKQGVEGRIWGCSSSLSKLKSFTEHLPHNQIFDIQEIDKTANKKIVRQFNSFQIVTYCIDINQYSALQSVLDNHILNSLD